MPAKKQAVAGRKAVNGSAQPPKRKTTPKPAAKATKQALTNGVSKPAVKAKASKESVAAAATPTPLKKAAGRPSKRRSEDDADEQQAADARPDDAPGAGPAAPAPARNNVVARPAKKAKLAKHVAINQAPTERLHVYVFGENESAELGLGTAKTVIGVKRPRLNPLLAADKVGVVQLAAGAMHVVALTHDNKILTWGVNDLGALGRDTTWDGGLKDLDENDDDSADSDSNADSGLNPNEALPHALPDNTFPEGTIFTQVAAADSSSYAVTDDGLVFGWGTFRSNEGVFGFTKEILVQRTPLLIPGLKKIKHVSCGANHVLALDDKGNVFAWGSGQQNQLGRRVIERTKREGLVPREFGLPKKAIKLIGCGAYHSFAVDNKDRVWAWGLNNYGETGIVGNAGEEGAVVLKPAQVSGLASHRLRCIDGGLHHSIAVTEDGQCLVWGRTDGFQSGVKIDELPEDVVKRDERGAVRILLQPFKVPNIEGAIFAAGGGDHSLAVTGSGQAYSWGFSASHQTGQGTTDDIEVATLIDNTAIRGKSLNWVGAGDQYSILTAPLERAVVNGTGH